MSHQRKAEDLTGAGKKPALRVAFDSRLKLEFHGSKVPSDTGLLACRELDAALGLTELVPVAVCEQLGSRGAFGLRWLQHRFSTGGTGAVVNEIALGRRPKGKTRSPSTRRCPNSGGRLTTLLAAGPAANLPAG